MTEKESIEKSHQIANEWFAHHQATVISDKHLAIDPLGDRITIIDWKRPDTMNYYMRYIINGGNVIVTGDVGDAIYAFGYAQTTDTLLSHDWHYFVHKCVASETGRKFEMKMPGLRYPVPNVRAIGHFIGLQMALKQIKGT